MVRCGVEWSDWSRMSFNVLSSNSIIIFLLGLSTSPIGILHSWQDCTFLISYRPIISSYHHGQCGRMFSRIGECSATIVAPIGQSYSIHAYMCSLPILFFLPLVHTYNMDMIDQTSAFFIGVILGTALIAQKCQALIDATKASCVPSSSHHTVTLLP